MTDTTPPAQSATERMQALARLTSSDYPPHTAARVVDTKTDEMVEIARRGEPVEHYGQPRVRAQRYTLGSGPVIDVTFVFSPDGLEYAVIDYTEGTPRAFRVIAGSDAELLHTALRRYEH